MKPSHGYRAVHLVVRGSTKLIEVQIRTTLQHVWAEMCEKCADIIDPAIKYGGGPAAVRNTLDKAALLVQLIEDAESALAHPDAMDSAPADELRNIRDQYVNTLHLLIKELRESGLETSS